jgi:hypothetical protein
VQHQVLTGQEAEQFRTKWLERITHTEHGWRQLWRCRDCKSYWEMSWEGGGGFDDGVMKLRRLSLSALRDRWPEYKPE